MTGEGQTGGGDGSGSAVSREELAAMLLAALMNMDRDELRRLAAIAVQQFAGMEPGAPSAAPTTCTARSGCSTSTTLPCA